ncbi:MAG: hypothetical protein KH828_05450 [Clostridiales bacterium]|nr:hypothetical protein [Clostridiales bacterium]
MSYGLWMAAVLPVIVAGGTMHFKMKEQSDKRWNILPKCLATWMMVCTAAVGVFQFGSDPSGKWILAAMVLFLIADGCLELHFFLGMGVFAAGHLALIIWLALQGHFTLAAIPVWCVCMAGTLILFRRELSRGKEDPRFYLMILYPAVLMAMTAVAVTLPFVAGQEYLWAAVGAFLFSVSDMMVGKSFFGKLPAKLHYWALALYYCGIFCLSMVTWM